MRRQDTKLVPTNCICECECHTNAEVNHPVPCCFVCPKCKQNIMSHLYNDHVHTCSRANAYTPRPHSEPEQKQPRVPSERRKLIDLPVAPGSARSRYRKR